MLSVLSMIYLVFQAITFVKGINRLEREGCAEGRRAVDIAGAVREGRWGGAGRGARRARDAGRGQRAEASGAAVALDFSIISNISIISICPQNSNNSMCHLV